MHKSLKEFVYQTVLTTYFRVSCPYRSKKLNVSTVDPILADNKEMHNILEEFKFWPN